MSNRLDWLMNQIANTEDSISALEVKKDRIIDQVIQKTNALDEVKKEIQKAVGSAKELRTELLRLKRQLAAGEIKPEDLDESEIPF